MYLLSLVPRPRPAFRRSVLQATESWAGPGNEASVYYCLQYLDPPRLNIMVIFSNSLAAFWSPQFCRSVVQVMEILIDYIPP